MTDALDQIKKLYFGTTKATIVDDFDAAIDLLKSMPTEDERDRAAVFMEGLAEMRSQWAPNRRPSSGASPRGAAGPARSGQTRGDGRRPR